MNNQIIFIGDEVLKKINTEDIVYIESDRHRTLVHLTYSTVQMNRSLSQWIEIIDKNFLQIHRGILVNVYHISQMYDDKLLMDNAKIVPVSRRRLTHVREVLKHFIGDSI